MSRGYMSQVSSDYICVFCGDVCVSFDKGPGREHKYSIKSIYCPICMTTTDHIRLGQKDIIKCQLESKDVLDGIDFEIYNLLCANDARKVKELIKK